MLYEAAINSKYMHSAISFGVVKAKCVQRIMILLHGHNGNYKYMYDKLPLQYYG